MRATHQDWLDALQGARPPGLVGIAKATAGASGSDIRELCIRAARLQIAELLNNSKAAVQYAPAIAPYPAADIFPVCK